MNTQSSIGFFVFNVPGTRPFVEVDFTNKNVYKLSASFTINEMELPKTELELLSKLSTAPNDCEIYVVYETLNLDKKIKKMLELNPYDNAAIEEFLDTLKRTNPNGVVQFRSYYLVVNKDVSPSMVELFNHRNIETTEMSPYSLYSMKVS